MNKTTRRITIIAAVLLVLVFIAGIIVGNIFYNLALNPNSDKSAVMAADHNAIDRDVSPSGAVSDWLADAHTEDMYMQSADGLRLRAIRAEQETATNKWAILCHGYTSRAEQMSYAAAHFYDMDYNLLIPDARGHGESEGDYIGMGWPERKDMVGWIEALVEENPQAEIILYGVSMGGATVMMTSGEKLPANVKAIVEDCGYTSVFDEFAYQLKGIFGLPSFPVMNFSSLVAKVRAGYWLGEASALEQVAKSVTPTLFIHGDADTFVPASMVYEAYDACGAEKELYVVEGAGHGGAASVAGDEYWDTVEVFLSRYI